MTNSQMNHREGGWSKEVRAESQEQRNKGNGGSNHKNFPVWIKLQKFPVMI
jgi:hypothetical protein